MRGRTIFILPLEILQTEFGRIARFIGARFSNLNTGLFNESFALGLSKADVKAIFASIRRQMAGRADLIQLSNMPETWRGVPIPWLAAGSIENHNRAYQLPLRASMEETLEQIHAKRKRKLYRKSIRQFEEFGGFEHVIAETSEDKNALLTVFFRQKRSGCRKCICRTRFGTTIFRPFFRDAAYSSQDVANAALTLHALRLKDAKQTVVAVAGLSRKGGTCPLPVRISGERCRTAASPGEFLFYLMIEQACADRAAIFDFGIGYQLYKKNWCPVETMHYDALVPISLRGKAGAFAISAARG